MRLPRSWSGNGFTDQGWDDIDDSLPSWTATVSATWTIPVVDTAGLVVRVLVGTAIAFAGSSLAAQKPVAALLFAAFALAMAWQVARGLWTLRSRERVVMTLGPDTMIVTARSMASPTTVRREHAGWLIGTDVGLDGYARMIELSDDGQNTVFGLSAGWADVDIQTPGVPAAAELAPRMPVAVLLGAWWPHPARRITRAGNLLARRRWRDPGLSAFPREERRQRRVWSLVYLTLAIMCLVLALSNDVGSGTRVIAAVASMTILAWLVRSRWRQPATLAGT